MTRISTSENLTIDYTPAYWRLSMNGDLQERTIIEASPGRALRYVNGFAERRRLPGESLPGHLIKQVVLGWSDGDQSWHLGLLLTSELAQQRGSRWCELARWYDPDTIEYATAAEHAARALSQALDRPFRLIPPVGQAYVEPEIRELPALPLKCGIWKMEREGDQLQLVRAPNWLYSRALRVIWYTFWAVIYLILSIATLTTKLALPNSGTLLPNPRLLPLLGLGAAAVLLIIVLKNLFDIFTQTDKIVIDPVGRTITARRGSSTRWQFAADQLQAVYVSQVVGRRRLKRTVYHGEINLQTSDQKFRGVIVQDREEERLEKSAKETPLRAEVIPLTANEVDTDLQAAAVYIATALGNLPCLYDQRVQ
ncbi:MAG: hypothetical protein H7X77_01515 [Anaerolineae bacterium]|nr:hypothetical protein [Anaerolineae bacterium]